MLRRQNFISLFTWHTFLIIVVACHDYKGFDDSVMFKLNWPGKVDSIFSEENSEVIVITTPERKEKYKCYMPNFSHQETYTELNYDGPEPFDLISTLFSESACSYRVESYWTYEVCHGSYVKQFHEEREGKSVKTQEYYLGRWNKEKKDFISAKFDEAKKKGGKWKTIRIDGVNLPYLEVEMTDGTYCELNGEHRSINIQYVCYPHGKNDIYSVKETATCSYELVILTPALCNHPDFNPKESNENVINCIPMDGSPPKPKSLLMMEVENMRKILDVSKGYQRQPVKVVKLNPKDGTIKAEDITNDLLPNINKVVADALAENAIETESTPPLPKNTLLTTKLDLAPVLDFLEGKHCLTGGFGWWKYEFCYGRHIRQYHVDQNEDISITLGIFNVEKHKEWLKINPHKRPENKKEFFHLYQGGSICHETGKKRETEVHLKCLEDVGSISAVKLNLMEPRMCSYILTLESPLICHLAEKVDEDGLIGQKSLEDAVLEALNDKDESNLKSESDEVQEALERMFH